MPLARGVRSGTRVRCRSGARRAAPRRVDSPGPVGLGLALPYEVPMDARPLYALSLAALLAVPALPGCGGGGGDGGGTPPASSTATIAGRIVLDTGDFGIVAEREPNGSIAVAQPLPPLPLSSSFVVAGDAGVDVARYGLVDAVDAYRFLSLATQAVDVTLDARTDGILLGVFDLAVFRTSDGQPVASSAGAANPKVVTFTADADASYDVVVSATLGSGAYTLELASSPAPVPGRVADGRVVADDVPPRGLALSADAISYALDEPDCAPRRVVVRVGTEAAVERVIAVAGARLVRRTSGGSLVLEVPSAFRDAGAREAVAAAARLRVEPDVAFAEPDWIVRSCAVPNDPEYGRQWNLDAIGAPSAWDVTTGSPSVVVGVLDSGIVAHPDLDPQRVAGYDFVSDPGTAGDGDGRDPDPTDPGGTTLPDGSHEWHGSHVAGILGARGNDGYGVCGVAPGCRLMPLRVTGQGGGTVSDLADALRYAAGLDATAHGPKLAAPLRVVNVSLGTPQPSAELEAACDAAEAEGTLVCAAAGNSAGAVLFPAAYPSVLAVGAVDGRLVYASYSNHGPSLDCAAPGGNDNRDVAGDGFPDSILSTVLDETQIPAVPGETYYSGTSMATPHVAGVAALVLSVDPTLSLPALRTILLSTCRDLDVAGVDDVTGHGLVQAGEAVRAALAGKGTPRVDAPRLLLSSTSMRLPADESVATVHVDNAGGGVLHVAGVSTSTDSGLAWLSSFLPVGPHSAAVDAGMIAISVNRTGLPDGTYAGSVLVSDGFGTIGSIRVVMEVGAQPLTAATILVVARQQPSGVVRASAWADGAHGFRYAFHGLPPGTYVVTAGTDVDGDGFFCEAADWCGSFGGVPAAPIFAAAGDVLTGRNVTIRR